MTFFVFVAGCLAVLRLIAGAGVESTLALPHVAAVAPEMARLEGAKQWWARVGTRLYHTPAKSSALGENIEDYYVAVGSREAVPAELLSRRVGGQGRFHIFYLPSSDGFGASLIQSTAKTGTRRSSISKLQRLEHGSSLSDPFAEYFVSTTYTNPLDQEDLQSNETKLMEAISSERYMEYLERIVNLGTRSYSNSTAIQAAVGHLQEEFNGMGLNTCLQDFEKGYTRQTNVVAFLEGTEPDKNPIVVGAHFDSRPFEGPAPGAEDNGSGLAGLLAIARAAVDAGLKPKRSLYFVAFAGEEAGLWGSENFAESTEQGIAFPEVCKEEKSFLQKARRMRSTLRPNKRKVTPPIHAAIIMDEIGWVTPDEAYTQHTVNLESRESSNVIRDHMTSVSKLYNGDTLYITHSNNPFGSDHMSFLDRSVNAVLTINGDDEGYPHYHQSTDTIENVMADYAVKIVKMNAGTMFRMSME